MDNDHAWAPRGSVNMRQSITHTSGQFWNMTRITIRPGASRARAAYTIFQSFLTYHASGDTSKYIDKSEPDVSGVMFRCLGCNITIPIRWVKPRYVSTYRISPIREPALYASPQIKPAPYSINWPSKSFWGCCSADRP